MKKDPLVSIIIVNFNGGKVIEECLASIKKLTYSNFETIIIDNASTDGTGKYATIKNKKNLGFAVANNQGAKLAKGKYILLLNNDTKVPPKLLNILVKRAEKSPKIGVIQPKIYIMDNPQYLDNAGSFLTQIGFLRHWGFQSKDSAEFGKEREIFSAKGACMLIRKDVIDQTGLFDESFFMYFEESDFCWRVWIAGYKIIFYPKIHIYHKVGFTTKRADVLILNYHYYKNRITSLIKNFDNFNVSWIVPLHIFLSLGIATVFFARGSMKKSSLILLAIKWNLTHLGAILEERKKVQKLRKVPDSYIFERIGRKVNMIKLLMFKDSFFEDFKRVEKDIRDSASNTNQ